MTKDIRRSRHAIGHPAIIGPEEAKGIRLTRIIGKPADRDSGVAIRSRAGRGHGGQDANMAGKGYSNCMDHIDHEFDPAVRRERLENIIAGAREGKSTDFGALIRLARASMHPDIRNDAWKSLLEHFSDKEGLLLFIALHAESPEIRNGAIDRMRDRGDQTKYFLDLTMNGSRFADTRRYAFCTSMKVRFGEEIGQTVADAIGLESKAKRNEAAYRLARGNRNDLLELVGNESHFEDTRQYAKELAKIAAKGPAKRA